MSVPPVPHALRDMLKHLDYTYDRLDPWLIKKLNRLNRFDPSDPLRMKYAQECASYTKEVMYNINTRYRSDTKWSKDTLSRLTDGIYKAVISYQNTAYVGINRSLRGDPDWLDEQVIANIENMDKCMLISPRLSEITHLYRHAINIGVLMNEDTWTPTSTYIGQSSPDNPGTVEVAEGMVVREMGYMSTTDNMVWTSPGAPSGIAGYNYMIVAPKGLPYINPDVFSGVVEYPATYDNFSSSYDEKLSYDTVPISYNEAELILPRGLTLKVVKILTMDISDDRCSKTFYGDKLVVCVVLPNEKPSPKPLASVGYIYDTYLLLKSTFNPILKHRFGVDPMSYSKEEIVDKMLAQMKDNKIVSLKYENQKMTTLKFSLAQATIQDFVKHLCANDISSLVPIYRKTYALLKWTQNRWRHFDLPHLLYLADTKCQEHYAVLQHDIESSDVNELTGDDRTAVACYLTATLYTLRNRVRYPNIDASQIRVHDLGHYIDVKFVKLDGTALPLVIRTRYLPVIVDKSPIFSSEWYNSARRLLAANCGLTMEPFTRPETFPVFNITTMNVTQSKASPQPVAKRVMENAIALPQVPVRGVLNIFIGPDYTVQRDFEYTKVK